MKKIKTKKLAAKVRKLRKAISNAQYAHERGMANVNNALKNFEGLF